MHEEPKLPDGLKVERTPSGGWRFELPRPKGALLGAVIGIPFCSVFVAAGGGVLYGAFADGKTPWPMLAFMSVFFLFWSGLPLLMVLALLYAAFGRQALEIDDRALVSCSRLAPLPEWRRTILLETITALAVDESHGKSGTTHYLAVKTGKRERRLAAGLERQALEWLAARVAMLADQARGGPAAGRALTATLEADLLRDRLETGEVRPEDLLRVEAGEPPPEGSGIELVEQRHGLLRLRLAGRGGRFFLGFAAAWLALVGLFTAVTALSFLGVIGGDRAPWFVLLLLVPFWAVGIGLLLAGLRQRTLVEELEIRPESASWQARSVLGTSSQALSGTGLGLSQKVSYEQNYQPVYHLRLTEPGGRFIKFAGNLKPEAQAWLMARIAAALGPPAGAAPLPPASGLPFS